MFKSLTLNINKQRNEQIEYSSWTLHFLQATPPPSHPSQWHSKELLETYFCFSLFQNKNKSHLLLLATSKILSSFLGQLSGKSSLHPGFLFLTFQLQLNPPDPRSSLLPKSAMTSSGRLRGFPQFLSYQPLHSCQYGWPLLLFKIIPSLGLNDIRPLLLLLSPASSSPTLLFRPLLLWQSQKCCFSSSSCPWISFLFLSTLFPGLWFPCIC